MDIAPVQKTSPIVGAPSSARPSIQPAGIPVATDLPPSETVQQAPAGYAANHDDPLPSSNVHSPVVERNLSLDPDTQQIVYQAVNARGEIVLQLPDQLVMRQRAYANDLEHAAEKSGRNTAIERFV